MDNKPSDVLDIGKGTFGFSVLLYVLHSGLLLHSPPAPGLTGESALAMPLGMLGQGFFLVSLAVMAVGFAIQRAKEERKIRLSTENRSFLAVNAAFSLAVLLLNHGYFFVKDFSSILSPRGIIAADLGVLWGVFLLVYLLVKVGTQRRI